MIMVRRFLPLLGIACLFHSSCVTTAFVSPGGSTLAATARLAMLKNHRCGDQNMDIGFAPTNQPMVDATAAAASALLSIGAICSSILLSPLPAMAVQGSSDAGASIAANSKITTGGASTLQSGRTIAITRGVNLDNSNFAGVNLKGVAFQQSIVRDADFRGSNLVGASFFDATVDGSNFEGADMSLCNVEMAQFNRANLKNAILREMYVSGSTLFEGVKSIENSDWSETQLRRDQIKYLCNHPTAKGTNPVTGVDTRESLMCPE